MVVFTCNYCGDSVRKNQVEKHYSFTGCRGKSPALTCVDCLKDFNAQAHVSHTTCVTEAERYSAKGFVSKPPSEKGKKKQEQWINAINNSLNNDMKLAPKVRNLLQRIAEDSNVPQKKNKFINYCKNKFKHFHLSDFESTWDILEKIREEIKSCDTKDTSINGVNSDERKRKRVDSSNECCDNSLNNSSEGKLNSNGDTNTQTSEKKHKKNKRNHEGEPETEEADDGTINLKKVKKKSLNVNGYNPMESIEMSNNEELRDKEEHEDKPKLNGDTKLSKKEKKQKRKQEKYEKQLIEINNKASEKAIEDIEEDKTEENTKKMKKKKQVQLANKDCMGETMETNGESKKKKKKKHQEPLPETDEVEEKEEEECKEVENVSSKFKWEEIIIKVLETKGELPLKRLEKKVVSEYMNTCANVKSIEDVIAKFHKKIMKIPGVKVRKEVAKLVS